MQPDYPTSKEDAFRKVWRHFIVERNPPGVSADGKGCCYRTMNGDYCAIGILLPFTQQLDHNVGTTYRAIIKHSSGSPSLDTVFLRLSSVVQDDAFLGGLQSAHDGAALSDDFYGNFECCLRRIAEHNHITIDENDL
jgi:hypothetical protein